MCGFLGHGAHHGCSKCKKKFSGTVGSMDYSGFNRDSWLPRSSTEHRSIGFSILNERTQAKRFEIENGSGYRFTELLRLPYFDSIPCITCSLGLLSIL